MKFKYTELDGRSLDDPFVTAFHRQVHQQKQFLRQLYESYYLEFVEAEKELAGLKGESLELGSGGGFLKSILPTVITSDYSPYDWVDQTENAYKLSFSEGSLKAIYMTGVLHHLGDVRSFFKEVVRCLVPGGRLIMVEPHMSLFGRFFFQKLHHEPNDMEAKKWEFPQNGPLSDANTALPSLIFDRDIKVFMTEFPELRVVRRKFHTFVLYGLSGGLSFRYSMPGWSFPLFKFIENSLSSLMPKWLATMQTIELERLA